MTATVKRYRTDEQAVVAIVGEPGRKFTPMVWLDNPIRLNKVPNDRARRGLSEIQNPPTVRIAARTMLRAGKHLGITKEARRFLRETAG